MFQIAECRFFMMKPNQEELRHGIVEIGAEYSAIERVRDDTLRWLAKSRCELERRRNGS